MFAACIVGGLIGRPGLRRFAVAAHDRVIGRSFSASLKFAALLTIGAGLTIGIYTTLRERLDETTLQLRTKELERERALKLATEAQLASLESRIHPHFLFNTLNSISSLIPKIQPAPNAWWSRWPRCCASRWTPINPAWSRLSSELKIVADYLEISAPVSATACAIKSMFRLN